MKILKKSFSLVVISAITFATLANGDSIENKISRNRLGQTVTVIQSSIFKETTPLRDLPEPRGINKKSGHPRIKHENHKSRKALNLNALPKTSDPLVQKRAASRKAVDPIISFDGNSNNYGGAMDPSGAASENYYVQAVNVQYQMWDKSGKSVLGPKNLSTLWSGSIDNGDPIVFYDKFANRWFISQFGDPLAANGAGNKVLIAISKTSDPTGGYYTYEYNFPNFPDYPKYSIWHDGYYLTSNDNASTACVFEREKMIAGDSTAKAVILSAPNLQNSGGFNVVMPAFADGELPPSDKKCNFFSMRDDVWGDGTDAIQIFTFTTDWNNTSNCAIELTQTIETDPFDIVIRSADTWEDIDQPGTTQKIDGLENVMNYRVQFRKWIGYNTILITHISEITDNSGYTGIRWYELRDKDDNNWSIYQSGTYAPDKNSRFYGSMAMDKQGNIGLAYSISSSTIKPSLGFTGRMANDPLGEMTITENIVANGTGVQSTGEGQERFCDYSHMSMDPDDEVFWHTGQYTGDGGTGKTKIFSFKLIDQTAINKTSNPYYKEVNHSLTSKNGQLKLSINNLFDNSILQADIFSSNGKLLMNKNIAPKNNSVNFNFNVKNFASGAYIVRYGNVNFQKVTKIMIRK